MPLAVLIALVSVYGIVPVAGAGSTVDCNNNAIPDNCDLSCGPAGGPCDVPNCGQSADCNADGCPDECDIAGRCPPSITGPAPLNNNADTDSGYDTDPKVITDNAGNWVAVWESRDTLGGTIGTDFDILVARSNDNGVTWTDPKPLNNNAATDSGEDQHPQVTTDGAGNWVAVWNSNDTLGGTIGTDSDIFVARISTAALLAGDPWTDPDPLSTNAATDAGEDWDPTVTTDGAGNWLSVWRSNDNLGGTIGTDEDILVARISTAALLAGDAWTDPVSLNNNAATDMGRDGHARIATDGAGNWVAVWWSEDNLSGTIGTDGDILVARITTGELLAGDPWTDPKPLNSNADADSGGDDEPEMATDGSGNWVVVWHSDENLDPPGADPPIGTDGDILATRSTDSGKTWTDPHPLNNYAATDAGIDEDPHVTTDGAGNWLAVWMSKGNLGLGTDYDALMALSIDNGQTWTDPGPLNNNAPTDMGDDSIPKVTTDGSGNWVAVWDSNDTLGGSIGIDRDILTARFAFSQDCNANGIPDECELPLPLCQCETACQCTNTIIGAGNFQAAVGGCLVTPDNALEICIEPGNLFDKASLSVAEVPITQRDVELLLSPAPGRGVAVALYDLDPDGLAFQNPVNLTITKDVSNLNRNQRERLDLYFRGDAGGPFEPLGATCCVDEVPPGSGTFIGKCTTPLTHFSTYGFIGPLDTDGDGVFDDFAGIMDNCPTVPNPKQEDPDGDSIGHACDNQDIPTVSAWGLVIAALLILVAGTLTIRRVPAECA